MKYLIFLTLLNANANPPVNRQTQKKTKNSFQNKTSSNQNKTALNTEYKRYVRKFKSVYTEMIKTHTDLMKIENELETLNPTTSKNNIKLANLLKSKTYNYKTKHIKEFNLLIKEFDEEIKEFNAKTKNKEKPNIYKKFHYDLLCQIGSLLANSQETVARQNYANYELNALRELQRNNSSKNFNKKNDRMVLLRQIISLCSKKTAISRRIQRTNESLDNFIKNNPKLNFSPKVKKDEQAMNVPLSIKSLEPTNSFSICSPLSIDKNEDDNRGLDDDSDQDLYDDNNSSINDNLYDNQTFHYDDKLEDYNTSTDTYDKGLSDSDIKSDHKLDTQEAISPLLHTNLNKTIEKENIELNVKLNSENKSKQLPKKTSSIEKKNIKLSDNNTNNNEAKLKEETKQLPSINLDKTTKKENTESITQVKSQDKSDKTSIKPKRYIISSIITIAILLIIIAILYKFYFLKSYQD